jgi:hypothetical protein
MIDASAVIEWAEEQLAADPGEPGPDEPSVEDTYATLVKQRETGSLKFGALFEFDAERFEDPDAAEAIAVEVVTGLVSLLRNVSRSRQLLLDQD